MIDLPTQKDMVSPHHRRAVWALIAASVVFIGVIAGYFLRPEIDTSSQTGFSPQELQARKEALLTQSSGVELTQKEITTRSALISKPSSTNKLSDAQIQARMKLLSQ